MKGIGSSTVVNIICESDVQDLSFLQVRYELLDCNHAFLDSAMKLVDLMEHGAVKGGERLVPHLFQFLVLLANDQSKLVTVPQVCVKYIS